MATQKCTFKTQYTRTPESIRDVSLQEFKEPSKVKESLSYATDINTIYENYCKSGKLPLNGQQPIYDENFVKYDSLVEAHKVINEASGYFASLPTDIRSHYGNNLEKFVQAIHSNDEFLCEKGVLKKSDVVIQPVGPSVDPVVKAVDTPVQPSVEKPATDSVATA